jgi:hypothetical protein
VTTDQRFTVTIMAIGLVFTVMAAGLGLIVRITTRWTRIEDRLGAIADKITELVKDKESDHHELDVKIEKVDARIERHESWHDTH